MISKKTPSQLLTWADTQDRERFFVTKILHTICRIVLITVQEFKKNELSLRAGALTYTILLSLVPILAMSTAVVKGLGGGDQLRQVVYSYIETIDPGKSPTKKIEEQQEIPLSDQADSNLTEHLYEAVDTIFNYVDKTNFATLGTIGVMGIFLSVVLVFGNIETAMNTIWHVESGRSIMRKVADYLALVVLMPISINVGFAASAVLKNEALLSKFSILLPMVWIQAFILKFIPIFFLTLTLYVIYLFFPHTKVKSIPALTGALFASFFWFEAQNIYINLQVGVSKYNAIYGSFATLPLFLVWMYFGWLFILCGAQLGYAFQNKDTYQINHKKTTPSLRLSIAFDLMAYVRQSFEEEATATIDTFQEKFPVHSLSLVNDVTTELINHNLIHRSDSDCSIKPSIPMSNDDQSKIISAILGSGFSQTDGGSKSNEILKAAALSDFKEEPPQEQEEEIAPSDKEEIMADDGAAPEKE